MKLLIATLLLTAGVASATQFCCYKQITNEMDANLCLAEDQSDFDCPAIAAWVSKDTPTASTCECGFRAAEGRFSDEYVAKYTHGSVPASWTLQSGKSKSPDSDLTCCLYTILDNDDTAGYKHYNTTVTTDWSCPLISGNTHLVDWKVDDADQCCFGKGGWSDPCKY